MFQTDWITFETSACKPAHRSDATCCLCLQFRKVGGCDFIFFQQLHWSQMSVHTVLILITIVNTRVSVHILLRQKKRQKTHSYRKRLLQRDSETKCYNFYKMFLNSLYWFQWLSFVHTSSCSRPSPDAYECMLYEHLVYYSVYPHCSFLHATHLRITGTDFCIHPHPSLKLYTGHWVHLFTQHENVHLCWVTLFLRCLRENLTITDQQQIPDSLFCL